MCTKHREIVNKYTGQKLLVPCGKCPSCLQEKAAHRVSRIKSNLKSGYVVLLVSLTYNRFSCPYVDKQEAFEFSKGKRMWLNVYRDCEKRKVRAVIDGNKYAVKYKTIYKRHTLTTIDFLRDCSFKGVRCVKHSDSKIGVPYYPDYQHFLSRLRINLKRLYNYEKFISVYACSEYGEESLRPHFHLLVFIPEGDVETVRDAIFKSWPFSDMWRFSKIVNGQRVYKACQVAYSASSYVASYVNSGHKLSDFCRFYFKPKHSYSKGFGVARSSFSLGSILSALDRHEMSYTRKVNKSGVEVPVNVLIPAYVINRYFPRFKGYNRFSPSQVLDIMRRLKDGVNPYKSEVTLSDPIYELYKDSLSSDYVPHFSRDVSYGSERFDQGSVLDSPGLKNIVYLSDVDVYKISVRLNNAYERFKKLFSFSDIVPDFGEYCRLHRRVWDCYSSTALKLWLINDDVPMVEKYDNLESVFIDNIPTNLDLSQVHETDYNLFPTVVRRTQKFTDDYFRCKHDRRVRNIVYLQQDRHCEL